MIFLNNLKIAWRSLLKMKTVSVITIGGLSLGLAATLIMVIYVTGQFSVDTMHENANRIYRLVNVSTGEGDDQVGTAIFAPLGPLAESNIAGVTQAVRFGTHSETVVSYGSNSFLQGNILYTEPSFFSTFSFSLQQGDPAEALRDPFTAVLTADMAEKYFGDKNPVGEILKLNNKVEFEITGIVEPPPSSSSLQFELLLSFATLYGTNDTHMIEKYRGGWGMAAYDTFLLLNENASVEEVERQILPLVKSQTDTEFATGREYYLETMEDIYMKSPAGNRLGISSDIRYVYIFSAAALLILFISCFNYTNLVTARYMERAREVGVRKSAGASRLNLIGQFMGESLLVTFLSLAVALLLLEISLPYLNSILELNLDSSVLFYLNRYTLFTILVTVATALIAGLYPAVVLSGYEASEAFHSNIRPRGGGGLRKSLITLQFALSSAILVCTLLVQQQMEFIRTKNLGLNPDQVMVIPDYTALDEQQAVVLRDALAQHSGILSSSVSGGMVARRTFSYGLQAEQHEGEDVIAQFYSVDDRFLNTLDLTMNEGRFFRDDSSDVGRYIIVNEALVETLEWEDPIGKLITYGGSETREVVGVVRNFHTGSLHEEIGSVVMIPHADAFTNFVSVRFDPAMTAEVIDYARSSWKSVNSSHPFDYFFLDETFQQLYSEEQRMASIFHIVTFISILVACMGLYGLTSYMVKRRTKEIGIRKILGAKNLTIALLVSREFLLLITLGFLLAVPVSWFMVNRWLADFAYRIEPGAGSFLVALAIILILAVVTISWQSLSAARANPASSLRSE